MRVILPDVIFDGRIPTPRLFQILNFAWERRHRVLAERGAAFGRWRASRSQDEQEQYDEALHASEELETREPSDSEIRIGDGGVAIDEAIERLERPFLVFVENDKSDRSFIEAVAATPYRERLREMHRKGRLMFYSRGGISHISTMLESLLKEFPEDAFRTFAIFDSDAPAPGESKEASRKVKAFCEERGVAYRMLRRREIENYLTRHALNAWASEQDQPGPLKERVELLYGVSFDERMERRHHFDMKHGFGDTTPHRIYDEVPDNIKKRLRVGFGRNVHDAFSPDQIREVDLRAEGAWEELSEMIEALVRSMR